MMSKYSSRNGLFDTVKSFRSTFFLSVSRETDAKMSVFFLIFWHQKMKLADGFMGETG